MEKVVTLIVTALVVSADSFVVGFGVSVNKQKNLSLPAAVAFVTMCLCLVTSTIGLALQRYLHEYVDVIGSALLFALGCANFFKKENCSANDNLTLKECFAVGFTVGLDGAIANLTLVDYNFGLVASIVIVITHFLTVLLGQVLANKVRIANFGQFSSIILIALAVIKLL